MLRAQKLNESDMNLVTRLELQSIILQQNQELNRLRKELEDQIFAESNKLKQQIMLIHSLVLHCPDCAAHTVRMFDLKEEEKKC